MSRISSTLAFLALAAVAASAAAAGDMPDRVKLEARVAELSRLALDEAVSNETLFEKAAIIAPGLFGKVAHNAPPRPDVPVAGGAQNGVMPVSLIVARLQGQVDQKLMAALQQAQASKTASALVLHTGVVTLKDLAGMAVAGEEPLVSVADGEVTFHAPLIVWNDATLVLEPGDRLVLDPAAGAFLLSAGRLVVDGASIVGKGGVNKSSPTFKPMILVALSGSAEIRNSQFRDLGFVDGDESYGVVISNGTLYPPSADSYIRDSLFVRSGSLSLVHAKGIEVTGNRMIASVGRSLLIDGGQGMTIDHNVLAGDASSRGIKVASDAHHIVLSDNIVVGNHADGVFVDRGTTNVSIRGNLIAANKGSGLGITSAACVDIENNALVANTRKGISVKSSFKVGIRDNLIGSNKGAAVSVDAQPDASVTTLSDNAIGGNKIGISGVQSAVLELDGNDLTQQSPRLLAGELTNHSQQLLASMAAQTGHLSLASSSVSRAGALAAFSPFNLQNCTEKE